jgi:crossover junction endodeoxyribonuclease RusA
MVMSKAGRDFKSAVQEIVTVNNIAGFNSQRLNAIITIFPRDKRKFDLDNRLKSIFDSLQDAGVYDNDEQFDKIQVARGKIKLGGGCTVVIFTED